MLKGHDNFPQMRIAMSRPNNLRDILCRTSIPDLSDHNTSDVLHKNINNIDKTQRRDIPDLSDCNTSDILRKISTILIELKEKTNKMKSCSNPPRMVCYGKPGKQ
jgi:hypothetical protein